ncbi:MAG: histidine kinase dimerization/phospho-acceptor domain-containing protein [Sulfuricellaceae bacterium]|nr:histidine kinase dimerization/phospho-acceptor domain-containing protein [Sulfuricellaceae bacterium]
MPGWLATLKVFLSRPSVTPEHYWKSLHYFNLYRLILSGLFIVVYLLTGSLSTFGAENTRLFVVTSLVYGLFSLLMAVSISLRWPRFNLQLSLQTFVDVLLIVLLMHASGGIKSGISLLLVVSLASSSLISQGRQAMFYAAMAAIAVLLEQSYTYLVMHERDDYFHAAMLGMGFFATAGLGHFLAKRVSESERLVAQKSVDLENLAQVNELVIQHMQDGVLVVDGSGRVRSHNQRCEQLIGPPPRIWSDLRLNDYSPELADRVTRWRKNPDEVFNSMRSRVTGKHINTRFSPISQRGEAAVVIFLQDYSQVQAQSQQIKLAALGRLTANIAHEIRNPLSAIGHATQLLQEDEHDKTETRLLQIIRDNTLRLDRLVQDVLQLNRRDRAQRETIDTESFLGGFVEQFCLAEKIPAGSIVLELDYHGAICFDRGHLHQILWNLCANGWRHGQHHDASLRICLSQAHLDNVVQIDVIDDGPGVEKALVSQLFEPFFTTFSSGTGLGLYIAREVCEANGANLDYIEVAPGGQFRICCKGGMCETPKE